MKLLPVLVCLFLHSSLSAQSNLHGQKDTLDPPRPKDSIESSIWQMEDSIRNLTQHSDSEEIDKNFNSNIQSLIDIHAKNKAKQKRAAIIRIAIGILLLIVLIVGLNRRRKK